MITKAGIKVYGVAGAGKTTFCMNLLHELFEIDTSIDYDVKEIIKKTEIKDLRKEDIMFTSFSKAAIESIKTKILNQSTLMFPKGRNSPFKTLNQLTWQLAGFDRADILQKKELDTFFRSINIKIELEKESTEKDIKEIILDFYSNLLDAHAKPLEDISDREIMDYYAIKYMKKDYSIGDKISIEFLMHSIKKYDEWKKKINKKDYIDSIIYVIKNKINVDCRVLIVDEAQDLSFAQTKLIELWIKDYDKEFFVISGDDDQTVHEWRGATPEFFIKFSCENMYTHLLQKSYRLPQNTGELCNSILKTITYRKKKQIFSSKPNGKIEYYTDVNLFNIYKVFENYQSNKDNFFLFRTNKLKKKIADYMFKHTDIVFGFLNQRGDGKWSKKFISISNALNKLMKKEDLTKTELSYLFHVLPSRTCLVHGVKKKIADAEMTEMFSIKRVLAMTKIWNSQQNLLDFNKNLPENRYKFNLKERIIKYIQYISNPKNNEKIITENEMYQSKLNKLNEQINFRFSEDNQIVFNTQLGTYHSAKGLEADNVFVFLGTSENFRTIDDSERRCFYVACSRTQENLFFINSIDEDKTYLENEFSDMILFSTR